MGPIVITLTIEGGCDAFAVASEGIIDLDEGLCTLALADEGGPRAGEGWLATLAGHHSKKTQNNSKEKEKTIKIQNIVTKCQRQSWPRHIGVMTSSNRPPIA